MERIIVPSKVSGVIKAPSSKSMTQRAIAASLLAVGDSTIINPSYCDDSLAAMSIATGLGARLEPAPDKLSVTGTGILRENKLNCGESGLAIRMFSPVAALYPEEIIITGSGSLKKRPMGMIEDALSQFGVRCKSNDGFLPLSITGPLTGGKCDIDGSVSSQLLTGLLMALPLAKNNSNINVINLKSKPYIDMTLQVLEKFGIRVDRIGYNNFKIQGNQKYIPQVFSVESDWSGGAFLLVAGAISGDITVEGLRTDSRQSDKAILTALDKAGARLTIKENSIGISNSNLKAFEFDATESPDLFPPLAALAAYCEGVSAIRGVSRLKYKESNRAGAIIEEFKKMNIDVEVNDDFMLITGGKPSGAYVNSHDDHRIAMAAAVTAIGSDDKVYIKDSQCVSKSYPGFFDDLRKIGVTVFE